MRNQNSHASLRSFTSQAHGSPSFLGAASVLPPHLSSVHSSDSVTRYEAGPSNLGDGPGVMVVTGDADETEVDGVVENIDGDAKLALRDQLRRKLSGAQGGE